MTDGIMLAHDLTTTMVALTTEVWSQRPGDRCEPLAMAWKRIFGEHMGVPVLFSSCVLRGRDVVVRFYPRGRLAVVDPMQGAAIRVVNGRSVEAAANIGGELRTFDPMAAHFQANGIADEEGTATETQHHAKVAGAAENFLKSA